MVEAIVEIPSLLKIKSSSSNFSTSCLYPHRLSMAPARSISVKKVRQLNFDPDEGIFTWNGKNYNSLNSLVDAWNKNSSLTDDDINVLKRKLKSQANISL